MIINAKRLTSRGCRRTGMDLKKLSTGEWVTAASGIVLLIFSFFHWYSYDFGPFSVSRNGWQSPGALWGILAVLLGVVLAAHVLVGKLGGVELPERLGRVGWGVMHLAGGALAFVFMLIKLINHSSDTAFGFYVSLIAAVGLGVGGYLMAKETGELPSALGGSGGATPPPSPPPSA
jgi:hypothetical protein